MVAEEIPAYLQAYLHKVNDLQIFGDAKANHILLNEYKPGQGIMSHFDGPLFYPTISTVSIGSHTVLEFHRPRSQDEENLAMTAESTFKLLVEPRSLLILKDDLYHRYMHSIKPIEEDDLNDPLIKNVKIAASTVAKRGTRFSLTVIRSSQMSISISL